MERPGEDEEEEAAAEELDWRLPEPRGALRRGSTGHGKATSSGSAPGRIVVHLDLDCFYAQVETICSPELRGKPLAVRQKGLVVTCNYEARGLGVKKATTVKEAKEKCPQLVLVNGEDLTKYREMSYKVTALLEEYTPLVERLGLDENFVDVTEMVEKRLEEWGKDGFSQISVSGHVYGNQTINLHNPAHVRLAAGSQIAAEMRESIHARLDLTGCAGIASNKLLSKLISGTFRPNQQTVLLPESRQDLMASLEHIWKVPGIGFKTAQRLAALGLTTLYDLQTCSSAALERELGVSAARHLQKLSRGEDDAPVTPTGPPQSLSDEDSFKECSSEAEVKKKVGELIASLSDRLHKDGRKPHTIKLTIRQFPPANQWPNRESRQCPIPSHMVQKIGTGDSSIQTQLVGLVMKLFHRLINVKVPFHLTLLSVCFSNLKAPPSSIKQSIGFYFTRLSSSNGEKPAQKTEGDNAECAPTEGRVVGCEISPGEGSESTTQMPPETPDRTGSPEFPLHLLPAGIDYDVFNQLPREIKEEIISSRKGEGNTATSVLSPSSASREEWSDEVQDQTSHAPLHSGTAHQNTCSLGRSDIVPPKEALPPAVLRSAPRCPSPQHRPLEVTANASASQLPCVAFKSLSLAQPQFRRASVPELQEQADEGRPHDGDRKGGSKCVLPSSVDAKTFSELPTEIQKELLVEWESREPTSKVRALTTPNKLKLKKVGGRPSPQKSNSLLRYFKPA